MLAKSYINMQTALACTSKKQVFSERIAFGTVFFFFLSFLSKTMVISDLTDVQRFLSRFYSFIFKTFRQRIFGKCQSQFNLFTCSYRRCWIRRISDCFLQRGKRNNHCHGVSFQIVHKDQYSMEKSFKKVPG